MQLARFFYKSMIWNIPTDKSDVFMGAAVGFD